MPIHIINVAAGAYGRWGHITIFQPADPIADELTPEAVQHKLEVDKSPAFDLYSSVEAEEFQAECDNAIKSGDLVLNMGGRFRGTERLAQGIVDEVRRTIQAMTYSLLGEWGASPDDPFALNEARCTVFKKITGRDLTDSDEDNYLVGADGDDNG